MADLLFDPVPADLAIAYINRRLPLQRDKFDALLPELQGAAFTVSGIARLDALQAVLNAIAEVPAGADFKTVQKRVKAVLLEHIAAPKNAEPGLFDEFTADEMKGHAAKLDRRARFIVSELVSRAYVHSKWQSEQGLESILPWRRYVTRGDEKVRASHVALDGIILPSTHPFWLTHYDHWDYRCRCETEMLTDDDVDEIRATEAGKAAHERTVLDAEQVRMLEDEGAIVRSVVPGSRPEKIDVRARHEKDGGTPTHDPRDLKPDIASLRERYTPAVFAAWEKWAKATRVNPGSADGMTVWDWAAGKGSRNAKFKQPMMPQPPDDDGNAQPAVDLSDEEVSRLRKHLNGEPMTFGPLPLAALPGAATAAIAAAEKEMAGKAVEHGRLYRAEDGMEVGRQRGGRRSVAFPEADLPGAILTHNHPNLNPPSFEDAEKLIRYGMGAVRVVAPPMVYSLSVGPRPLSRNELVDRFNHWAPKALAVAADEGRALGLTRAEVQRRALDAMWRILAEQGHFHYHIERLPGYAAEAMNAQRKSQTHWFPRGRPDAEPGDVIDGMVYFCTGESPLLKQIKDRSAPDIERLSKELAERSEVKTTAGRE